MTLGIAVDKEYEIDRWRILPGSKLGEGEFGDVWKALLLPEKEVKGNTKVQNGEEVAVKALKEELLDSRKYMESFYREIELLKSLKKHKNLVNLIGVCTSPDGPLFMVLEYCQRGSLHRWLRRCQVSHARLLRLSSTNSNRPNDVNSAFGGCDESPGGLSESLMLQFAHQIASGMAALAEQKIIHRDLAARNILMTWHGLLKIADFGLSRDIPDKGYYRMVGAKVALPVRWMAPEAMPKSRLGGCVFTEKSDVWSYGITLWEIASLGKMPFSGVPTHEIYSRLLDGYSLSIPANCPHQMRDIMNRCWVQKPDDRPTFAALEAELEGILTNGELHAYLELCSDSDCFTSSMSSELLDDDLSERKSPEDERNLTFVSPGKPEDEE